MWIAEQTTATLHRPRASIKVDATRPGDGISLALADTATTTQLWQVPVLASARLVECYPRDNDFVATYDASPSFPFRTQLYWSLLDETPDSLALQLTVSLQTDLLDTHPVVIVSGATAPWPVSRESTHLGGLTLLRPADSEWSLALSIHPSDAIDHDSQSPNRWPLFAHFLEKGVIRRARLLAAVVPRGFDVMRAAEVSRKFVTAAPPLTV